MVAVGTVISHPPSHRSRRAGVPSLAYAPGSICRNSSVEMSARDQKLTCAGYTLGATVSGARCVILADVSFNGFCQRWSTPRPRALFQGCPGDVIDRLDQDHEQDDDDREGVF